MLWKNAFGNDIGDHSSQRLMGQKGSTPSRTHFMARAMLLGWDLEAVKVQNGPDTSAPALLLVLRNHGASACCCCFRSCVDLSLLLHPLLPWNRVVRLPQPFLHSFFVSFFLDPKMHAARKDVKMLPPPSSLPMATNRCGFCQFLGGVCGLAAFTPWRCCGAKRWAVGALEDGGLAVEGIAKLQCVPCGSKPLHACRKLLGNYFSGCQEMIICAITCEKCLGNDFSALSGNSIFIACFEFLIPESCPNFEKWFAFFMFPSCPLFLVLASRMYAQHAKSRSPKHGVHVLWLLTVQESDPCLCMWNVDRLMFRSMCFVLGSLLGLYLGLVCRPAWVHNACDRSEGGGSGPLVGVLH